MIGGVLGLEKLMRLPIIGVDAYSVVLVNGRYMPEISDCDCPEFDVFEVEDGGVNIRVADGANVSKPIHIIHYFDCGGNTDDFVFRDGISESALVGIGAKNAVVVGQGVKLVLLESYVADRGFLFSANARLKFDVASESSVRRYAVFDVSEKSRVKLFYDISVADNARFFDVSAGLCLGEFLEEKDLNISAGAEAGVYSSIRAGLATNAVVSVSLSHNGDGAKSDVGLWAVDDGRVEFMTDAKVVKGVSCVETSQVSRILLNSDGAIGRIKPFQYISSEGAKAYHGAVVSGVAPDELFFLSSRGLSELEAKRCIAESLMNNILAFVGDEKVQGAFADCLDANI